MYMYMRNVVYFPGIKDDHRNVRNSALFAIGQFAEHLQVHALCVYETSLKRGESIILIKQDWCGKGSPTPFVDTLILQGRKD